MVSLVLQGSVDLFADGSIGIRQNPVLLPYTFHPIIPNYRAEIPIGVEEEQNLFRQDPNTDSSLLPAFRTVRVPPTRFPTGALDFLHFNRGTIGIRGTGHETLLLTPGYGFGFYSGVLSPVVEELGSGGALTDFAFWDTVQVEDDPSIFIVESATSSNSGTVGNPWTRHRAIFTLHPEARYLGIGGKFASQQNNQIQHATMFQVEALPVGETTPTPYSDPRELQVYVLPDRLNYAVNPDFRNNTDAWTNVVRVAYPGDMSRLAGRLDLTPSDSVETTVTTPGLTPGEVYLFQVQLRAGAAAPVRLNVDAGATGTILYNSGGGRRTYTAKDNTVNLLIRAIDPTVELNYLVMNGTIATSAYFSRFLVEHTDHLDRTFFDGDSGPDYMWAAGQTEGNAPSFYYKNFLSRYAAVNRLLEDNTPLGIGAAEPKFAALVE